MSPPNDDIYNKIPVYVSLNGVDWVDTDFTYSYYIQAVVQDIEPKIGAISQGTLVFVKGKNFSNITDPELTKCKWTMIDNVMGEERA